MGQIFSLSEAAGIGLHSMVLIAMSEKGLTAQAIAERTSSSRHHIAKVLQRLTKHNLLKSWRGPNGGFMLNKDRKAITLLDVYEAVEGVLEPQECALNHDACAFDKCLINNASKVITTQIKEYLQSRTLDSYLHSDAKVC